MKMKKSTLKALKGSIKKWEKIVAEKGLDEGIGNCPLCAKFHSMMPDSINRSRDDNCCVGCPVMEKTGQECCEDSPYSKWTRHRDDRHYVTLRARAETTEQIKTEILCNQCRVLAQAEVDFLKRLLPS